MPIKPENQRLYPDNWPEIRTATLDRDGHRCKWCRVANHAWGIRWDDGRFEPLTANTQDQAFAEACRLYPEYWDTAGCGCDCDAEPAPGRIIRIVLTIAHLDHDPTNNEDDNLAALCQRCHNRHDRPHRAGNADKTRDAKRGQLRLGFAT